jgi:hypothetical protein
LTSGEWLEWISIDEANVKAPPVGPVGRIKIEQRDVDYQLHLQ